MRFYVSFWAAGLSTANDLPPHLEKLYKSIGHSNFAQDPEVCAEREPVPVEELIEPFSTNLDEAALAHAAAAAREQCLKLAAVVVAVYTLQRPAPECVRPHDCELRFIGTFPQGRTE
jgi:hypothetical protein